MGKPFHVTFYEAQKGKNKNLVVERVVIFLEFCLRVKKSPKVFLINDIWDFLVLIVIKLNKLDFHEKRKYGKFML